MSWRDTIKSRSEGGVPLMGSFRGAKFIVPTSNASFGRRAELHEYPMRDKPWVEDLGRKARKFEVVVFVDSTLGDYLTAKDALIAALETAGPGTLVHPWYGRMTVSLMEPAPVSESTADGGRATFRMTFVESGELVFPSSSTDTAATVETATDDGLTAATDDFEAVYNPDGLPEWGLTALSSDLYSTLSDLELMVSGVTAPIAAEIRQPANMAAAIVGAVQQISYMAQEPLRALTLYQKLFSAGDDDASLPADTATRKQLANCVTSMHWLTRRTAVIEACRMSSQADYQTRDDALNMADGLLTALDDRMEEDDPVTGLPVSDTVYEALASLRASVATDLRTRGAMLPDLMTFTPAATLPALVVAHRIYGDATRADEIIARNDIHHPGFVPGGESLEVLNA